MDISSIEVEATHITRVRITRAGVNIIRRETFLNKPEQTSIPASELGDLILALSEAQERGAEMFGDPVKWGLDDLHAITTSEEGN